jgi:tetratricopeptide (TPR) repeat protein
MATLTQRHIEAFGVKAAIATDGEQGFKSLRTGAFNALLLDWKTKNGSPLALLCKIRRMPEFAHLPIVITTGTAKREDFRILSDYHSLTVLEKPLKAAAIDLALKQVCAEATWYKENESKLSSLVILAGTDGGLALKSIDSTIVNHPNPVPLLLIAANLLADSNFNNEAISVYDRALKIDRENLAALSGKSKVLFAMNKHWDAMQLLKVAHRASPKNLDRLALMGEVEISLQHPESAIEYFQKALEIDAQHVKSRVGLSVAQNFSRIVSAQAAVAQQPTVAKMLNNLGVALAQQGAYERGLKYYVMAMSFIADADLRTKVAFNLGMGFKRWDKPTDAKKWFSEALKLSKGKFEKAKKQLDIISSQPVKMQEIVSVAPKTHKGVTLADTSFLEEEVISIGSPTSSNGTMKLPDNLDALLGDIESLDLESLEEFGELSDQNFKDAI